MKRYQNATKDYLFALLISGNADEKGDALCELCDRYKEINYWEIRRLAVEHGVKMIKNNNKSPFNENELQFIERIEEAKRYVKGELELDHWSDGWFAMDYREEFNQALSIDTKKYDKPIITDNDAENKKIDVVKCCEYCGIYYVE